MSIRIQSNVTALSGSHRMNATAKFHEASMARQSFGNRMVKVGDDIASFAMSEKINSDKRSSYQALRNTNDGTSLIQVAEGSVGHLGSMIIRLKELAVQSATDTLSDSERVLNQIEYDQVISEMDRIVETSEFNGLKLLNGSEDMYDVQIGIDESDFENRVLYDVANSDLRTGRLGLDRVNISTKEGAQESLDVLEQGLSNISMVKSNMGAASERMESVANDLNNRLESMTSSKSKLSDADFYEEASLQARSGIISQAQSSVQSQVLNLGSNALSLL